jgi:hypothetical protein
MDYTFKSYIKYKVLHVKGKGKVFPSTGLGGP